MATDGLTSNQVALPPNLLLTNRRARFALLNKRVCMSNSASNNVMFVPGDPLSDDPIDFVVPMSPTPPKASVTGSVGNDVGLTGKYNVRVTFAVKNSKGAIIAESPMGPPMDEPVTLADENLTIRDIPVSDEFGINTRRLYRTLANGSKYFHWTDVGGNGESYVEEAISDEVIQATPVSTDLGNPPGSFGSSSYLELMTAWKGRLFGRAGGTNVADLDTLLWSAIRLPYAWNPTNTLPIPPVGADSFGITALIPRRDVLGIAKRDSIWAINSPTPLSGNLRQVSQVGAVGQDSVVVHDDYAWFLSEDGIYMWGSDNIPSSISADSVHPWFTTDNYFNRAAFDKVVGFYNTDRQSIVWLMPSRGQSELDRWIEYYPHEGVWLGPHMTSEFTPTFAIAAQDIDSRDIFCFSSTNGGSL